MEQVPKIVRERMKAATPVVNHPDADVLTAFSERSLSDRERTQVLEHLARCGECRDIVALALPQSESVQTVRQPSPKSWLAWPALRWSFIAAGVVLVASLGVMQYRKQVNAKMIAYQASLPTVAQQSGQEDRKLEEPQKKADLRASYASAAKSAENKPASALKSDNETVIAKLPARRDESAGAIHGYSVLAPNAGALPHGPRVANQMQLNANTQQQNALSFHAVPATPPAAPAKQKASADLSANAQSLSRVQTFDVATAAPAANSQADNVAEGVVQSQPLREQSLNGGQGDAKTNPPKPSAAYMTSTKIAGRETAAIGGSVGAASKAPNARWTINASGALQRSLDQGNTWQDVNVMDNSSAGAGMMLAVSKRAKELEDKDAENDKIERSKSASIVFRAVSANGSDVWAGGSAGMLYHSIDSGAHWIRVTPSSAGTTLTGEILTVAFTDPQHGKVSTSTSELWSTDDGGQTWQKQ